MSAEKQDLSEEISDSASISETPDPLGLGSPLRSAKRFFNLSKDETDFDKYGIADQAIMLTLKNERYASDTKDRKWLAVWTATVIPLWLFFVLVTLWGNTTYYKLSETVLVTLLGTTTLNVLGLAFIVLKGHFGGNSQKNDE